MIEWLSGPMVGDGLMHGCCMCAMMLVRMGAAPQNCEAYWLIRGAFMLDLAFAAR